MADVRRAELHTYRTHAFIFVWSSLSAAIASSSSAAIARGRLRTYDDEDEGAQDGAHTCQLMHCLLLCDLILEIHFMVNR